MHFRTWHEVTARRYTNTYGNICSVCSQTVLSHSTAYNHFRSISRGISTVSFSVVIYYTTRGFFLFFWRSKHNKMHLRHSSPTTKTGLVHPSLTLSSSSSSRLINKWAPISEGTACDINNTTASWISPSGLVISCQTSFLNLCQLLCFVFSDPGLLNTTIKTSGTHNSWLEMSVKCGTLRHLKWH